MDLGRGHARALRHLEGVIAALDDEGAPNFAALQAALSSGQTQNLVFFLFDWRTALPARA